MLFDLNKIPSSHRQQYSFWDRHGGTIIFISIVVSIIVLIWLLCYVGVLRERKKNRMVLFGKDLVDSMKIKSITLSNYKTIEVLKGEVFIAPLVTREGYEFAGWFYDTACTKPYETIKIKKDITLYPKWGKQG